MNYPLRNHSNLGSNNLDQVVTQQLGFSGFEVVRTVYSNLEMIHYVYNSLSYIKETNDVIPDIKYIHPYIKDMRNISLNLQTILDMNQNINVIKELAPKIKVFSDQLDSLENTIETNSRNIDEIKKLYMESESTLNILEKNYTQKLEKLLHTIITDLNKNIKEVNLSIDTKMKQFEDVSLQLNSSLKLLHNNIKENEKNSKILARLNASDLVDKALFTQKDSDIVIAKKAIRESEKSGNDETINKERLSMKADDLNLFKVINRNNLRLAQENSLTMLKEGCSND